MPTNALPLANEPSLRSLFNEFSASDSALGAVSAYYALCAGVFLGPPPDPPDFFPALRDALLPILPYKHKALIDSLDARWTRCSVLRDKGGQRRKTSLIVSGAGPCGLRAAVESLLLGIPTLVLDLRTDFSRHNVLKTWQGTVDDLVSLGLATFLPGFKRHGTLHCATKEIQNCLLKAALLLGADVKFGVGVCGILDPSCVLNVGDEGASAAPGQWRVWTLPEQSARAFLRTVASRTEARNDREADNPAESKDSEPAELSLKPGEQDVSRLKQTSKVDYLESPVPDPLAVLSSNDLHSLPANAPESGLFDDSGIRTGTGTEIRLFPFSSLIIAEGESSRLIRRLGFSRKVSRFANAIGEPFSVPTLH